MQLSRILAALAGTALLAGPAAAQAEKPRRPDVDAGLQWLVFINQRLPDPVVKQYYDKNKVFFDKVLVRASHILLSVPATASQADKQMIYNRVVAIRQEILSGK